MLHVIIATRNRDKIRELTRLLAMRGIRWHALSDFPDVPPVKETGLTFEANARAKACAVARAAGRIALADDSGLEVEALGWRPGVRSARFAGRHGDHAANNRKLLRALAGVPPARRRARYRCVLALASPSRLLALTRGAWTGRIALAPRGSGGFGYDPVFHVPGLGKTVGQSPASVKRRLSHRANAARRLRPALRRLVGVTGPRRAGAAGARRRLA